ncbi:MAG: alpha/beta fold hydrolase [Solirubrobacterales bacterium]
MGSPGEIRRGYVDSGLGQLHCLEAGAGPALVLLPQAGRSSRMYLDLLGELASECRAISIDVPGSGRSVPLPDREVSMAEIAAAVAAGLAALGVERADVFGLHGGNKVGAALAADHPDLVRRFVFAGMSHSIVPGKEQRDAMFLQTPAVTDVLEANSGADPLPAWAGQLRDLTALWLGPQAIGGLADPVERRHTVELAIDGLESFQDRPAFYRAAFEYDLGADLARIAAPTLILEIATPREDREVGRQGEALLATIPDSTLLTLEHEDVYAATLEDRVPELAAILREFFANAGSGG